MTQNIYSASCVADLFKILKNHFPDRKRPMSLAQFSKLLGYKSPRLIGMVIQKKRNATYTLFEKLMTLCSFDDQEKYFCDLIWQSDFLMKTMENKKKVTSDQKEFQAAKKSYEKIQDKLSKLRKKSLIWKTLKKESMNILGEWHYSVILAGLDSPHFPQNPESLSKILGGMISPIKAQESLLALEHFGLIHFDDKRNRWMTTGEGFKTDFDIPNKVIRRNHQDILKQAHRAIDLIPVDRREFIHVAIPISTNKLPQIKSELRQILNQFTQDQWETEGNQIYRFGLYFFPQTEKLD